MSQRKIYTSAFIRPSNVIVNIPSKVTLQFFAVSLLLSSSHSFCVVSFAFVLCGAVFLLLLLLGGAARLPPTAGGTDFSLSLVGGAVLPSSSFCVVLHSSASAG